MFYCFVNSVLPPLEINPDWNPLKKNACCTEAEDISAGRTCLTHLSGCRLRPFHSTLVDSCLPLTPPWLLPPPLPPPPLPPQAQLAKPSGSGLPFQPPRLEPDGTKRNWKINWRQKKSFGRCFHSVVGCAHVLPSPPKADNSFFYLSLCSQSSVCFHKLFQNVSSDEKTTLFVLHISNVFSCLKKRHFSLLWDESSHPSQVNHSISAASALKWWPTGTYLQLWSRSDRCWLRALGSITSPHLPVCLKSPQCWGSAMSECRVVS